MSAYLGADLKAAAERFLPCVRYFFAEDPVLFVEAEGAVLKDQKGKEYLDVFGSHGCTTLLGYNHPAVIEAAREQIGKLFFVSVEFPTEPVIALAEKLVEITPEPFKRVYFANAGTEAVEAALFLAKKYTKKYEMISLYGDFHGRSHGSRSLLGYSRWKKGLGPLLPGITRIPSYYCYRCSLGLSYPECRLQCASMLEDALFYDTSGEVAAFVVEPIQGTAGFIPAPDGYFQTIKKVLDKHGILLFVDEVFSAFGSTGKKFCFDHYGILPDMFTFSKTLGAGIPISGLMTTDVIAEAFAPPEPPLYFTTFGSNPVMASVALAVLKTIENERLWERAAELGEYWMNGLRKLQNRHEIIGDVRGRGLLIAVELVKDRKTKKPAVEESQKLKKEAARRGLILPCGMGYLGNIIRMCPSAVMTKSQIDHALSIMDQAFSSIG
jgi:4-aminobutyrate aminotransferase-like enzyme